MDFLKYIWAYISQPKIAHTEPTYYEGKKYNILNSQLPNNVRSILETLNKAGYDAMLTGGCIRDKIANKNPKDFDIATNAKPAEVKKLFKNSILIGKRFQLVHVGFAREIIEVATYRKQASEPSEKQKVSEDGLIQRDNVFGSINQDASRRDFTINALYYDYKTQKIIDYADGIKDSGKKIIRIIGNPEQRYVEDPVRILRAIRFATKLNFVIEKRTRNAIDKQKHLLEKIASERLFIEIIKTFYSGEARKAFNQLEKYDLIKILFPLTYPHIQSGTDRKMLLQAFKETDKRYRENKQLSAAYLLPILLWPALKNHPNFPKIRNEDYNSLLKQQSQVITITKKIKQALFKYGLCNHYLTS